MLMANLRDHFASMSKSIPGYLFRGREAPVGRQAVVRLK